MNECKHDWKETYYGVKCSECGLFYPHGSEPWLPDEEEPEENCCSRCGKEYEDFSDLGCEYCDRRHPLFGLLG